MQALEQALQAALGLVISLGRLSWFYVRRADNATGEHA
jgi:hypothetical protein